MAERIIRQGDIVDTVADAIVFSTNEHLFLSGGAGASLLGKHGKPLQQVMDRALAASGAKIAHRGSIFEIAPEETWGRMFAVVAANGFYETSCEDTEAALREVLRRCSEIEGVKTVSITALGTGYGNMEIEDFVALFCETEIPEPLASLELVIHSELFFREACQINEQLGSLAEVKL
jgi:O-acetyl-ADP-ribose deacetylase (regulator of RNase III)